MEKPSNAAASAHKVRVTDLPQFAQGKWCKTFLPTLYDKFFTSNEPFDAFAKGSDDFIVLLQATVEEVFPEVKYGVTSADSIHFLVSFPGLSLPLCISTTYACF